jgi:hypothetical protein
MIPGVSVACEIDFVLSVTVTLGSFAELASTEYCLAWLTDYGKGVTCGKSNHRGVLVFPLRLSASAFGSLAAFDPSPCQLLISFHKGAALPSSNNLTGHEACTKQLGSVQLNLVEKVKLPLHPAYLAGTHEGIPLVTQNEPHRAFKFLFLATEKASYREQLLVKVSLECLVKRCRLGNDYYTSQSTLGGAWRVGTLADAFDLGLDFRTSVRAEATGNTGGNAKEVELKSTNSGNLANSGKGTTKGKKTLAASMPALPLDNPKSDARKTLVCHSVRIDIFCIFFY